MTRAAAGTVEFQAAKESPVLLGRHHLLENDSGFTYEHCLSTTQWPKYLSVPFHTSPECPAQKAHRKLLVCSLISRILEKIMGFQLLTVHEQMKFQVFVTLASFNRNQWIDHWLGRNDAGILLRIWCLNVYTVYTYVRYIGTAVPFCNIQKEVEKKLCLQNPNTDWEICWKTSNQVRQVPVLSTFVELTAHRHLLPCVESWLAPQN